MSEGVTTGFHRLGVGTGILAAVLSVGTPVAQAGKNSAPAQVMMSATMPPTFSIQAAQASLTGASGTVEVRGGRRGGLQIRGQIWGRGGNAAIHIPVSLAANTRSFLVEATMDGHGTAYLAAPGLLARRLPMRGQAFLGMATGTNQGRGFFTLERPLPATLEIVLDHLAPGEASQFSISLTLMEFGY